VHQFTPEITAARRESLDQGRICVAIPRFDRIGPPREMQDSYAKSIMFDRGWRVAPMSDASAAIAQS